MRRSREIRPLKRLRHVVGSGDWRSYDLEAAKDAHAVISKLDKGSLCTQGTITKLPYPGIGEAPSRPGGEIRFLGRAQLRDVLNASRTLRRRRLLLVGPKGIGKSCFLRAYACCMIRDAEPKHRVVCIWNMEAALQNPLQTMKNALLFTYCLEDAVLQQEIQGLASIDAVVGFLESRRRTDGEMFHFIVDGAEVVDTQTPYGYEVGDSRERRILKQELDKVVKLGIVVYGRADMLRQFMYKDPETEVLLIEQGFYGEELQQFMANLSVLGALCSKFHERRAAVELYAADHPLSLVVLDRCCRMQALSKVEQEEDGVSGTCEDIDDDKVVKLLEDEEDWDAALKRFPSAGEIASIRITTQELLETAKIEADCHRLEDMTRYDRRFVIGNALEGEIEEYCTSYIWRIYTEEFRTMEERLLHPEGAWEPYCRYLLEHNIEVNWAEMGWLCENLIADVIKHQGLKLGGMFMDEVRTRRFSQVPKYGSWKHDVETPGTGVFFVPLTYNYYGSVDGVLVWRDLQGLLHFIPIQVTVNEKRHQHSAGEFMNLAAVENWIPDILLDKAKWVMHFVFLCCVDDQEVPVPEKLTPLRSGGAYGTVGYNKHTVSFESALSGLITAASMRTLKEVAKKRDEAAPVSSPVAASSAPVPGTGGAGASGTGAAGTAALRRLLQSSLFSRQKLNGIGKKNGLDTSQYAKKDELADALAVKLVLAEML